MSNLRDGLDSLMTKIRATWIIIICAGIEFIVVVLISEYYWTVYQSHLNNKQYYWCLSENDSSLMIYEKIINYANKYRDTLIENEHE